jgi:F0F1-type ATP synthase assembly protein I
MGLPGGRRVDQRRRTEPNTTQQVSRYLGAGLTSGLSTLLFLYLGSLADAWLGTAPWLTLIGAFVGAAAGFYYMYHHLVIAPGQKRPGDGAGR